MSKDVRMTAVSKLKDIIMKQEFVKKPNIPDSRAAYVIMSDYVPEAVKELGRFGIKIIVSPKLPGISGAEAFHADMSFCHLGDEEFFVSSDVSSASVQALLDMGACITYTDEPVTAAMPSLNVCILGTNVLCNTRTADKKLLQRLTEKGHTIIHTNQRYTKCCTAIVNENAVITSDPSIHKICLQNHIDVLKITCGHIELSGYDYGFIGGACGLIDKGTLVFCGDITRHPDYRNIKAFSLSYGVSLYSLSSLPLYDIGGIITVINEY